MTEKINVKMLTCVANKLLKGSKSDVMPCDDRIRAFDKEEETKFGERADDRKNWKDFKKYVQF